MNKLSHEAEFDVFFISGRTSYESRNMDFCLNPYLLFNVQLLYHHFSRQCHMGRGRGSSRSINVTGHWPSLPVPNKAPLHSLAKSQSCTLTDSAIFVEFNVSFAKQYNFYTVHTHLVVWKGLLMPVIASRHVQDLQDYYS